MSSKITVVSHAVTSHILGVITRLDTTLAPTVEAVVGTGLVIRAFEGEVSRRVVVPLGNKDKPDLQCSEMAGPKPDLFRKPLSYILSKNPDGSLAETEMTRSPKLTPAAGKLTCACATGFVLQANQKLAVRILLQSAAAATAEKLEILVGEIAAPATTVDLNYTSPPGDYQVLTLVEQHKPILEKKSLS